MKTIFDNFLNKINQLINSNEISFMNPLEDEVSRDIKVMDEVTLNKVFLTALTFSKDFDKIYRFRFFIKLAWKFFATSFDCSFDKARNTKTFWIHKSGLPFGQVFMKGVEEDFAEVVSESLEFIEGVIRETHDDNQAAYDVLEKSFRKRFAEVSTERGWLSTQDGWGPI